MKADLTPRKYGWHKEPTDLRDLVYSPRRVALPASADLRIGFGPVPIEDQGDIGSCTANALVSAMEYEFIQYAGGSLTDLSRLFLYYNERAAIGTVNEDSGAFIRDGIKSLAKLGVCPETIWPYSPVMIFARPDAKCYELALHFRAKAYRRVLGLASLKTALAVDRLPVAFGFSVYESFESASVARTGLAPMPRRGWLRRERMLGGHAVLAVGYNDLQDYPGRRRSDPTGCLICRNSWGRAWGDNGYFYLPYGFVTSPDLSDDYWAITSATFTAASDAAKKAERN